MTYTTDRLIAFFIVVLVIPLASCGPQPIPAGSAKANIQEFVSAPISSPLLHSPASSTHPDKNRLALLDIGDQALLLRIHLIRAAKHSIAMQTIIWVNDETGRLLMYELIQAAKRGVQVQLLVDHFSSEKHPEVAAFLATVHPNLKVKLYNPIESLFTQHRIYPSFWGMLTNLIKGFNKFNQRMHNKLFLVDDQVGITGGRNNQNAYYDQARGLNYRDRDILITGPVVADLRGSFDDFWNFELSVPIQKLVDLEAAAKNGTLKMWSTRKDFVFNGLFEDIHLLADDQTEIQHLFADQLQPVENAYFIADHPGKNKKRWLGKYSGTGKITMELARLVSEAKDNIYINTPYLVLSNQAISLFEELRTGQPDIDIRISTNSLAATDSWYCYAVSFQQKQTYLRGLQFKIYEFKPLPGDMRFYMPSYDKLKNRPLTPTEEEENISLLDTIPPQPDDLQRPPVPAEPYFCLHSKSFVIDDEITFIGSYNLDPRSENFNTEAGLVIKDIKFAALVKESIQRDMLPQNSWVIAENEYPIGLGLPNAILEEVSRLLPFIDPWPLRYAGSYELRENKKPVDPGENDFYEQYQYVGNFPDVASEQGDKVMGAWITKTLLSFVKPLL